jgi:hypothetical protein
MKHLTFFVIAIASIVPLRAGNLILNGGFEAGNFSGWDVTLATQGSNLGLVSIPHTGAEATRFLASNPGDFDVLAQTFTTVSGQPFDFSFFLLANFGLGDSSTLAPSATGTLFDPAADLQVLWDGQLVLDVPAASSSNFNYTNFTFHEVGTGSDTIAFQGYNIPGAYLIDDVSVTSTAPEPATWTMLGVGLAVCAASKFRWSWRNRRFVASESGSDTPKRP